MIRGTVKDITGKSKTLQAEIHNRFDLEVWDSKTGALKRKAVAYNTICSKLWSILLSPSKGSYYHSIGSYFNYIHYGTGSGTPSSSDSSLFSYLGNASCTTLSRSYDSKTGVYSVTRYIQIDETTAVGETLTEVGIASGASTTTLCTHAMLQDMNGNPISILKGDTDIINVYATVFVHFNPLGYANGSIRILRPNHSSSSSPDGKGLLSALAGLGGSFYGANLYPSVNSMYRDTNQVAYSSVVGSQEDRTITFTLSRLGANSTNIGGIQSIALVGRYNDSTSTSLSWSNPPQVKLSAGGDWYPGTEIVGESVGTGDGSTVDFALAFPYASKATLYVDGVEQPEVTVDCGPKDASVLTSVLFLDLNSTVDNHIPHSWGSYSYDATLLYNPLYDRGLSKLNLGSSGTLYASNDLSSWEEVGTGKSITIPEAFSSYKYWKTSAKFSNNPGTFKNPYPSTAVHFVTPPPQGSVITANYTTSVIAKDTNHVFDFSLVVHLAEYTEAQ